jgi:hypothetical protein
MGNPLEMGNLWQPCVETFAFQISKSVGWFLWVNWQEASWILADHLWSVARNGCNNDEKWM